MSIEAIPFTQYMLPDGRTREVDSADHPEDVLEKAAKLIEAGCKFEVEILTTGHVSLTITPRSDPDDAPIAHRITNNNHEVIKAINQMILECEIPKEEDNS